MDKISVVFNTLNEEKNLPHALASVASFADEIIVVDMKSEDGTSQIAQKAGAKVYEHNKTGYVEPARNYAVSKATGEWVLILDADEELPEGLKKKLKEIIKHPEADYYRIPRKNIVFGAWIKHSRWWPDYNIRFFKKGQVTWNEIIHSVPMTIGRGADLPGEEKFAIIHYNYQGLDDYFESMNRYTTIEAKVLTARGYKFIWKDLIRKPLGEFLSRYFAGEGFKDGVHGLSLALLQAFSELVVHLKVWQDEKFLAQGITLNEAVKELESGKAELDWWMSESVIKSKNFLAAIPLKILRKLFQRNA